MNPSAWLGGWLLAIQSLAGVTDLFNASSHDFGNVPRGSVNVAKFVLANTTSSTIHLQDVRASCSCSTPKALNHSAAPGEKIEIEVAFNTTSFVGERSVSIYATFDEPTLETVTLRVSGFSRQDVVFNPSQVDFGVLGKGEQAKRTLRIEYAGALDWRILEALPHPYYDVKVKELYRETGRSGYELEVALKADAPNGVLADAIRLRTNDPQTNIVQVLAQGTIESELSASPGAVELASVKIGEKISRKVLVRGRNAFTLESVGGDTEGVRVKSTEGARKVHVVSIEIQPDKAGKYERNLKLVTDLPTEREVPLKISGTVLP
jgi:hypothetical protein